MSSASSVVKQCLCGWADDLADEQLGLQLQSGVCVCVCVCLRVDKPHSGAGRCTEACLPLLTLADTPLHTHTHTLFFECTPFSCRHKLPLTDAASHMIYSQPEKKKSSVDLQSRPVLCVCVCATHVDV